jgi:angio-associated migratory cell protein
MDGFELRADDVEDAQEIPLDEDIEIDYEDVGEDDIAADEDVEEVDINQAHGAYTDTDTSAGAYSLHKSSIYSIAISPSGNACVTGSGDDTAHVWKIHRDEMTKKINTEPLYILTGHKDTVSSVGWSYSGIMIATGSYDCTVRIWDSSNGKLLHLIEGPSEEVEWVHWHPRGDVLLAGSNDGSAWMWEISHKTFHCLQVFSGHNGEVSAGCFGGAGNKTVLTCGSDGSLRLWNPNTGKCLHTFEGMTWHQEAINCVETCADKPLCLTGAQDGTAVLTNIQTNKKILVFSHSGPAGPDDVGCSVESVGFCDVQQWVATGATDGTVIVWDLTTGAARHTFQHDEAIVKLKWIPKSTMIVVSVANGEVIAWDARDGRQVKKDTGTKGIILDFDIFTSPSEAIIAVAGDDAVARLYILSY